MMAKLIYSILIICVFGSISFLIYWGYGLGTREYHGSQSFSTIEQAYEFQEVIIQAANNADADNYSIEISVNSPPEVSYKVILKGGIAPERNQFEYGNNNWSFNTAWCVIIIFWIFLFIVTILFLYLINVYEEGNS